MQLQIIAVGNKMPDWVTTAFLEYAKRFPRDFPLKLIEIPTNKHSKDKENQKILDTLTPKSLTIALDEHGALWNTQALAKNIEKFQNQTPQVNFLIGGPDGLSQECLARADLRWSLSPLTLPHMLVRIILIEQLYRAISILNNHPYHRV